MNENKQTNNTERAFIALFVLGFVIWFGGNFVRMAISYDLFETGTIIIRSDLRDDHGTVGYNIYLSTLTSLYTNIAYAVSFLTAFILSFRFSKYMKDKGWLLMIAILYFINVPIEAYYIYLDIQLSFAIFFDNQVISAKSALFQELFMLRFENNIIAGLKVISFLSAFTIIILAIWRPLSIKIVGNTE